VDWTPQLQVNSGFPALHSQHCPGSFMSPSSHCSFVEAHGFNYPYFHFLCVIPPLRFFCELRSDCTVMLQLVNWRPERGNELSKVSHEFCGNVTETLKHINYLSYLLFKWRCVHRSERSAEQWKLQPVNLLPQSSATCFQ